MQFFSIQIYKLSTNLLSTSAYEVDLAVQAPVHLPDQRPRGLHADHDPLLCDVQPQHRWADFRCRQRDPGYFPRLNQSRERQKADSVILAYRCVCL